jgi:hypothetical protein
MFAYTLETLVLRGVVRQDELGVLRLFGVGAKAGLPGNVNSVLPPARTGPDTDPLTPVVGYATEGVSPSAGRSCRHARSSVQQQVMRSAAVRWHRLGGMALAAAAMMKALAARIVASVGEVNPRLAILSLGTQGRSC